MRACIFDLDGLLINTEDIYKSCADTLLARHGRPPLPWSLKAQLMGVAGSSTGDTFHAWAQLPISREQYALEQDAEQAKMFPLCEPLPGAVRLLETLTGKKVGGGEGEGTGVAEVALASGSQSKTYRLKEGNPETRAFMDLIPEERRVLADSPSMVASNARAKPAPDVFLTALDTINASLPEDQKITPAECLVFEDGVPGVEAGRRAGMRVVWVPHPGLAKELAGREGEVLAGRTGMVPIGDEGQLGEVGDGWAEQLGSLEEFDYAKYGIVVPGAE